jgi:hypothetical protein
MPHLDLAREVMRSLSSDELLSHEDLISLLPHLEVIMKVLDVANPCPALEGMSDC